MFFFVVSKIFSGNIYEYCCRQINGRQINGRQINGHQINGRQINGTWKTMVHERRWYVKDDSIWKTM